MSIRDITSKFKQLTAYSWFNDVLLIILIVFLAFTSFELGRLSVENNVKSEIRVGERELNTVPAATYASLEQDRNLESEAQNVRVVASQNGTAYHYEWCSGAQRIKEENKIYFASTEEARGAGYRAAKNCKGLE